MNTAKEVKALFNDTDEWGTEMSSHSLVKGDHLVVVDIFYYAGRVALDALVQSWTHSEGTMAKFMRVEYGVGFKLVGDFTQIVAEGRWKKLTSNGVVGVELEVFAV